MAHSGSKTSVGLLSLKWNNYKSIFFETIKTLREKSKYTDATLAVDGHFYHVHKLVMSTCSDYFSDIFENTPCKAPIIVLKDVSKDEIEGLLSYMYLGEVNVHHNKLASFLKTAESLKIKGLAVSDDEPTNLSKSQHSNEDSSSLKKRRLDNNESSPAVPPVKSLKKSDTPLMMKVEMSSPDVSTAKQNKPPMDNIGSSEGDERERRIRTKISYEEDPVSDQDSGDVYEPHSPVTEQEDLEHDMPDHEAPDNVEENNASTSFFGTALQQSEDDQWRDMALANVTTSLHKQGNEPLRDSWRIGNIDFNRTKIRDALRCLQKRKCPSYTGPKPPYWPPDYEWRSVSQGWSKDEIKVILTHIYEYAERHGTDLT